MSINRRQDRRHKVALPAKILDRDGQLLHFGIVRNVSKRGCMVVGRQLDGIPDAFSITVAGCPSQVPCNAVWRTDHALGVQFEDDATLDPVTQRLFAAGSDAARAEVAACPEAIAEKNARTVSEIAALQDNLGQAVAAGEPLPANQVIDVAKTLAETLVSGSLASWLNAVRSHNSYTYRHCMTVSGLAVAFALELGFNQRDVQRMGVGALLHDIGKVKIPLDILDKPGKLTPEEYTEIKRHPDYGADILRRDGQFSAEVIELTLHHHELLDGSGYPDGLSGTDISDAVRLLTIADVYSALIDKRSYKDAMSVDQAYEILLGMEAQLESALVRAFKPVARAAVPASADFVPALASA